MKALKFGYLMQMLLFALAPAPAVMAAEPSPLLTKPNGLPRIVENLARSLEEQGTPVPYLRRVLAESERIQAKYIQRMGKDGPKVCPDWLTTEYIKDLEIGWANLNPHLELDSFGRMIGRNLRLALAGEDGFFVELLAAHQQRMLGAMKGEGDRCGYQNLKADFLSRLRSNSYLEHAVAMEFGVNDANRSIYRRFLTYERFSRSDFDEMEAFYKSPDGHDMLSEFGKVRLSQRVLNGTDHDLPGAFTTEQAQFLKVMDQFEGIESQLGLIHRALNEGLPESQAKQMKEWVSGMLDEVAEVAHSELKASVVEWAMDKTNE